MSKIPDKDAPSNPYQATTIADLITVNQLHWLTVAAESVSLDKDETAIALYGVSVYSLSRTAARQLEQYFAQVKMTAQPGHDHEHDCGLCGDTFSCKESRCHSNLSRYCHECKAELFNAA